MKILLLVITFIISVSVKSSPVNCEDAPSESKTILPEPFDQWAVVFCSPNGHVIGAIDGTIWITDSGAPFMFKANPKPKKQDGKHSHYFSHLVSKKPKGPEKTQTNKVLAMETFFEDQTLEPWLLTLMSNTGLAYHAFFFLKDNKIKHILGCVNKCKNRVLLTPKTLDELKQELSTSNP